MGLATNPFLIESRVLVTRVRIPFSFFRCMVFSTIHQFREAPMTVRRCDIRCQVQGFVLFFRPFFIFRSLLCNL